MIRKTLLTLCTCVSIAHAATAAIYYVKPAGNNSFNGQSWNMAFLTVSKALSVAVSGDEIWVAAGTYKPTTGSDRDASFDIPSGVKLRGGFSGSEATLSARAVLNTQSLTTILSGDINTSGVDDNSYQIVTFKNAAPSTVIEGFTITGAYGSAGGGGIYNEGNNGGTSTPTISHCKITANSAISGAGIYNSGSSGGAASAVLMNSIFESNTALIAGGAVYNDGTLLGVANPSITNCQFKNNNAPSGGAMYNNAYNGEASPKVTSCIFQTNHAQNHGGAIFNYGYMSGAARIGLPGARISGLNGVSSPIITNSVFQGNTAMTGGALYNSGSEGNSSPVLTNCTFQGNTSTTGGSAMYSTGTGGVAVPVVTNCIVWGTGNGVNPISNAADASTTISFSIVEGSAATTSGNVSATGLSAAMLFVNAAQGNLKLQAGSQAINKGNNLRFAAGQTPDLSSITQDLAGNTRIMSSTIDMGAYELSGPLPVTLTSIKASTTENRTITITWQTISEVGFDRFEIERSDIPSGTFQYLGTVRSNWSENGGEYSFTDTTVTHKAGNHYYRIKMIDADETYAFSRYVSAKIVAENNLVLYPNPVREKIHIQSGHYQPNTPVAIYARNGQKVFSGVMEGRTFSLAVEHLPPGIYSFNVQDNKQGNTRVFVKE
jgi:hypothetical protein